MFAKRIYILKLTQLHGRGQAFVYIFEKSNYELCKGVEHKLKVQLLKEFLDLILFRLTVTLLGIH